MQGYAPELLDQYDESVVSFSERVHVPTLIKILDRVREVEIEILEDFRHRLFDAEVDQIRFQKAPHQKFDRKVVDLLLLALHVRAIGLDPVFGDNLLGDGCDCFINFVHGELVNVTPEHDMSRIDKTNFKIFLEFLVLLAANCFVVFWYRQANHSF